MAEQKIKERPMKNKKQNRPLKRPVKITVEFFPPSTPPKFPGTFRGIVRFLKPFKWSKIKAGELNIIPLRAYDGSKLRFKLEPGIKLLAYYRDVPVRRIWSRISAQ